MPDELEELFFQIGIIGKELAVLIQNDPLIFRQFSFPIKHIGKHITASHRMALDEHHPITVMKAE